MTAIMKVDLVGPERRGLALGLNEFAGYLSVGIIAWLTGYIGATYALRPHHFYRRIEIAVASTVCSVLFVRDTLGHAHFEAQRYAAQAAAKVNGHPTPATASSLTANPAEPALSLKEIFRLTTWKERALSACS